MTKSYADFISQQQAKLRGAGLADEVVQEDVEQIDEISGQEKQERADAKHDELQAELGNEPKGPRVKHPLGSRHIFNAHPKANPKDPEHVVALDVYGIKPTKNGKSWHVAATDVRGRQSLGSQRLQQLTGQKPIPWSPKS